MKPLVGCVLAGVARSAPTFSARPDELEWLRRVSHDPECLAHDNARTRFEDARGRLWVGTEGGISRLDPGANGSV